MASAASCPTTADHMALHRELRRVAKGRNLKDETVVDILDHLGELGHSTIYNPEEGSILELLTFFKCMMRTILRRTSKQTLDLNDFFNMTASIYKMILDVEMDQFLMDIGIYGSPSCALSELTSEALKEILSLIEKHPFYQNFAGSFDGHVKHIETCRYHMDQYLCVIAIHNVHTLFNQIVDRRLQEWNRIYSYSEGVQESKQDCFIMNLSPNQALTSVILQSKKVSGDVMENVYLHPAFLQLNFPDHAAITQWRKRPDLGEVDGTGQKCVICQEDFPSEKLAVLSNCRHLCCIRCTETWFQSKKSFECCYCRVVSLEYMRCAGYLNLRKFGIF